jgi:hypothetical protein
MDPDKHLIKAFLLGAETLPLQAAPVQREWMQNTTQHFAHRCLPLRIANQFGWFLINDDEIEVIWNGGKGADSLKIYRPEGKKYGPATSHFGEGIVTWQLPYLFRTPPGYNLYVRGPTNFPKDGAYALDGIVETDWAVATFTMNWKITCVGEPVRFGVGEPIAMIMPVARGELEKFEIVIEDLDKEPRLRERHHAWAMSRAEFSLDAKPSSPGSSWQKHYFFGRTIEGAAFDAHQTAVQLKPVIDKTGRVNGGPDASQLVVTCPDGSRHRNQRSPSIFRRLIQRMRGRSS